MHHVFCVKVISMDFIYIGPAEIQTTQGPKEELDPNKHAKETMNPPGIILIVFTYRNGLFGWG